MARKPANTPDNQGPEDTVEPDPELLRAATTPQTPEFADDPPPGSEVAVPMGSGVVSGVVGEFSPRDIRFPRLQIAYGVGALSQTFNPGDLVLGDDNLLVHRNEPLNAVILSLELSWKEYLTREAYAAKITPKVFRTEREVHANGGTTDWVNNAPPTYKRAGKFRLLIEKPEKVECSDFGLELDGRFYAPAEWYLDKAAYEAVGPEVTRANLIALKPCDPDETRRLWHGRWEIRTVPVTYRSGEKGVGPKIKLLPQRNSPKFLAELAALFGN